MGKSITYEDVFNWTSNGVLVADADGVIVLINGRAKATLGLDDRDLIGRPVATGASLLAPGILQCLKTGEPLLGHHVVGDAIGHAAGVVVNITPIMEDGRVAGAVCNFQEKGQFEISARKLESYRLLNRQLHAIFQSVSDAIWVCDGNGVVVDINRASEKMNAVRAVDVKGKTVAELVDSGMFDQSVTSLVLEHKKQMSIVQHIYNTNNDVLVTGTPVFNENGDISLVVVNSRDLTRLNEIQEELQNSRLETEKLKDTLKELSLLELKKQEIVAESEAMQQTLKVALKLARLGASDILVTGESGTGKGLLAKFIHGNSSREEKPFIQINCAALPENLLEAELFGYEKGAFTGAREGGKLGLIELANRGTLFLDEIGELPLSLQAKLLKYLDDREVMRLGGTKSRKVDCTIISATNRDLQRRVEERTFRQDLYYRLNAFTIHIPPLRERVDDIFELIHHYLEKYNRHYGVRKRVGSNGLLTLQRHSFPGNVRELKNIVKKAVVMSDADRLDRFILHHLGGASDAAPAPRPSAARQLPIKLKEEMLAHEKSIMMAVLKECASTRSMARRLGIDHSTVIRKLRKHGLSLDGAEPHHA